MNTAKTVKTAAMLALIGFLFVHVVWNDVRIERLESIIANSPEEE